MRFRVSPRWPLLPPHHNLHLLLRRRRLPSRPLHASSSSSSSNSGNSGGRRGNFLLPGATMATILMLGILHARRLYDDKKVEDMKEKGIELEFSPDVKASFLRLLPLRSISRFWGSLVSVEVPVFMRPLIYKAWARAFHSDLQEAALPLEEYRSLQEFFIRTLKEGSRPIDPDPNCLVSPVDGKVLRLGELRGPGTMIEQVKGFSYSVSSLLGANSSFHDAVNEDFSGEHLEQNMSEDSNAKSWWRVSLASPKLRNPTLMSPKKGHLFPQNERAVRTIRNLYVENERVVLEGQWEEGFIAIAAIGATNVGSIKLFIEPELRTNRPGPRILHSQPPDERVYEPEGTGVMVKKGEEVAGFKMGSTVILIFEAPFSESEEDGTVHSDFNFSVRAGDKVRVGEAIGRWSKS